MLGRNGDTDRPPVFGARSIGNDGIETQMEIANANIREGLRYLVGIAAQGMVEIENLCFTVIDWAVVPGHQPTVAATIFQVLLQQGTNALQMSAFFLDKSLVSALLENVAGRNDWQADHRQQDQHQLHSQGRRPETAKKAEHGRDS